MHTDKSVTKIDIISLNIFIFLIKKSTFLLTFNKAPMLCTKITYIV